MRLSVHVILCFGTLKDFYKLRAKRDICSERGLVLKEYQNKGNLNYQRQK